MRFSPDLTRVKFTRSFGAVFAGKTSPFFFSSWKVCYNHYTAHIETAFKAKNVFVADFDLVSFYDLIDHRRLRTVLEARLSDSALLDLLFECLKVWTVDGSAHLGHGVPQGPEPSAFLAECFRLMFDAMRFRNVVYARYVDDIRLLARDEVPVRRALLRLDLKSRELGLVPQAQKLSLRRVRTLSEIRKTVPSAVLSAVRVRRAHLRTQSQLCRIFRKSLKREGGRLVINDLTVFKFSLLRLNARKTILRRVKPLLVSRPDCSWVLSRYLRKFERSREAADIILDALKRDPTYDRAASDYIEAMDVCEPLALYGPYRRIIRTVNRRSEEHSILLSIATNTFLGRRYGPVAALRRIKAQNDPGVRAILIDRLFAGPTAPFELTSCQVEPQEHARIPRAAEVAEHCALRWQVLRQKPPLSTPDRKYISAPK